MISQTELKTILNYCPETGVFTWKKRLSNRVKIGDVAGADNHNGYIKISIHGKLYFAHRLAWIYMTGNIPHIIDHINRNRSDNSFKNLRNTTQQVNCYNKHNERTVGVRKKHNRWYARIGRNSTHLGVFETQEEAVQAREEYLKNHL